MSDAVRVTRLLPVVFFNALAHFRAQRAAHLLRLFDGLAWRNLFGDFFGDNFFGFEVFAHPAADLFSDLGEPLHGREPGCPPGGRVAHRAHGPKIFLRGRHGLFFQPFFPDEAKFGQVIAQGLEFDGGLNSGSTPSISNAVPV